MTNESHIDEVLSEYSRDHRPADSAGTEGLFNLMAEAKQIMDAARVARFTEDQSFQICLRYLDQMFRAAAQATLQE
jgi:hypothetical protein